MPFPSTRCQPTASKICVASIPLDIATQGEADLIIDTGAEISLIKRTVLKPSVPVTQDMTSISTAFGTGNTQGKCSGKIQADLPLACDFHVIDEKVDIPGDGILGYDFISRHCNIEGPNQTITFPRKERKNNFCIPIRNVVKKQVSPNGQKHSFITARCNDKATENVRKFSEIKSKTPNKNLDLGKRNHLSLTNSIILKDAEEKKIHENHISKPVTNNYERIEQTNKSKIIPGRAEMIVEIDTETDGEFFCPHTELSKGVFLGNCLIKSRNKKAIVPIINTNERRKTLRTIRTSFEPLNNYNIIQTIPQLETKKAVYSLTYIKNKNRSNLLKENLNLGDDLNHEELVSLTNLCNNYNDIFYLPGDKLSYTSTLAHEIPIKDNEGPSNQKMYRLPEKQRDIIQEQVDDMLKNNIIVPSKSPWNSPLLVVPKKEGLNGEKRWRVVVDFRKLNNLTKGDAFPLPRIDDILDQLGHSRYFSTLDLASGYHQVCVSKKDREKTAFSTMQGHFEFSRMPFGLKGAPATFQRLMNIVLSGLQGLKCFVYLDDIVIYGKNLEDHNNKLQAVFHRLREHNLKLQPEKCHFLKKEVVYLGHKCSSKGALPDPEKTKCVQTFPRPRTIRQVQSFLGLTNYYRKFIPNFSNIAEPINKILRKDAKFKWTEECEKAFNKLKEALITPPLLIYPDFSKPFKLTTDASGEAIGAVLSQGELGNDNPIAYASRSLNKAERKYSTIERELLAIVWATKNFRCYLYGRKFTVYTDHKPLKGVFNVKDPTSRLVRFHHKLSEYDYQIEYKPGKYNKNADSLSRIPLKDTEDIDTSNLKMNSETCHIQDTQEKDCTKNKTKLCLATTRAQTKLNKSAKHHLTESTSPQITLKDKQHPEKILDIDSVDDQETQSSDSEVEEITDPVDISTILKDYHDSPLGGHSGVHKTYKRIRKHYKWKKMFKDIKAYIKSCTKCNKNKVNKPLQMPMIITDTAAKPFEKVYLDIVGPLPLSYKGNKYILTYQDDLTKILDCFPLKNCEAETVADCFYKNIILKYFVIPKRLITDQGTNFTSDLFKRLCKLLRIKKIQITAYHPQSNGSLERAHRPLIEYLRSIVDDKPSEWDDWLGEAALAHNHTPHTSSKYSPIYALYGFQQPLPSNLTKKPEPIYNFDDYCAYVKAKMQNIHKNAKENLNHSKKKSKEYYDKKVHFKKIHVGDKVLLQNAARKHKLSAIWMGPYEVTKVDNDVNCTIKIGKKLRRVHNNRLKLFM